MAIVRLLNYNPVGAVKDKNKAGQLSAAQPTSAMQLGQGCVYILTTSTMLTNIEHTSWP